MSDHFGRLLTDAELAELRKLSTQAAVRLILAGGSVGELGTYSFVNGLAHACDAAIERTESALEALRSARELLSRESVEAEVLP